MSLESFEQSPEQLKEFLGFMEEDLENVRRVVEFCEQKDLDPEFMIHGKSETVEESSEKTGTKEGKIVKTLVFMGDNPVAVLCSGDRRVDEEKLSSYLETEVRMANPSEVTDATGYFVGGVSPFDLDIRVLVEENVLENGKVKPAAGSRVVGVKVDSDRLVDAVDAEKADLTT